MDNRELNLLVPEARTQSKADRDGIDAEHEDESEVPALTVE